MNYLVSVSLLSSLLCILRLDSALGLREGDCEVCVAFLTRLQASLESHESKSQAKIEKKFKEMCSSTKKAENRFCYYVGGLEESATSIISEISKPLTWSLPAEKVCERLKKKDTQICDLRYGKTIDLKSVDLKKLKVKDLKKVLLEWDEICDGCLEKSDFIRRIEELKPKYLKVEL